MALESPTDNSPIADYALIGDGKTAALVGRDGSIDWLCYARFDGAAVFCRLLDNRRGGVFRVAPTARHAVTRSYVERTTVLETRFRTDSGEVRLTDCMPLHAGPSALLRRIEGLSGHVDLQMCFSPTFDFARSATHVEPSSGGCVAYDDHLEQVLALSAPTAVHVGAGRATAKFRVASGETRWVTLSHDRRG